MDISSIQGEPQAKGSEGPVDKCIMINGKNMCYDPFPTEEMKGSCLNVSGYFFCEKGQENTSLKKETSKFLRMVMNPVSTVDEASYMELKGLDYTIGFILSALAISLALYINQIIDYLVFSFVPGSMTLLTLFIIVIVITLSSLAIAFLEYRLRKAAIMTRVLEKASTKSIQEIIDDFTAPDD